MSIDALALGELIRVLEGVLVGDTARNLPDPALGLTMAKGLFLGRPLREASFLTDKEVVVQRARTANTNQGRDKDSANVNDAILVEFSFELPPDSVTTDQRDARDAAYVLDTQIRGLVLKPEVLQPRGVEAFYVETAERYALTPRPDGYGSAEFIVLLSTYRVQRIESLTGGAAI